MSFAVHFVTVEASPLGPLDANDVYHASAAVGTLHGTPQPIVVTDRRDRWS
jgi:hypothetical protein